MTEAVERYRLADLLADPYTSRLGLGKVAAGLRAGEDLPAEVRERLADALEAVAEGEDPRDALGLPTDGRNVDYIESDRRWMARGATAIGRYLAFARAFVEYEFFEDSRPDEVVAAAVAEAAEQLDCSPRSVREAVRLIGRGLYPAETYAAARKLQQHAREVLREK